MEHTLERSLLHPWPFRNQTQTHHGPVVVPVPSIPECLVPMVWDWQAWLAAETDGRACFRSMCNGITHLMLRASAG